MLLKKKTSPNNLIVPGVSVSNSPPLPLSQLAGPLTTAASLAAALAASLAEPDSSAAQAAPEGVPSAEVLASQRLRVSRP